MKNEVAQNNFSQAEEPEELGIHQNLNFEQILMRSIYNINNLASKRSEGFEQSYRNSISNLKAQLDHWFDKEFKSKLSEIENDFKTNLEGDIFLKSWQAKIIQKYGTLKSIWDFDKRLFMQEVRDDEEGAYYDRLYEELMRLLARKGMLLKRSLAVEG